jgi:hypothetical protein
MASAVRHSFGLYPTKRTGCDCIFRGDHNGQACGGVAQEPHYLGLADNRFETLENVDGKRVIIWLCPACSVRQRYSHCFLGKAKFVSSAEQDIPKC